MIPRYARPDMTALWEAESRFSIWLEIETHALDAMVKIGHCAGGCSQSGARKRRI